NPDADDPVSSAFFTYCTPHQVTMNFNGMAGNTVFVSCHVADSPMGWNLVDPDALFIKGDEGPRSDVSTFGLDAAADGLSATSETYWGTSPTSADTDGDGINDGKDNCKTLSNADQADYDHDGVGDPCDPDIDGDGVANGSDTCPNTAVGAAVDSSGCSDA